MAVNPPHDYALHLVWNHAVFCAKRDGLQFRDEDIDPRYEALLKLFTNPDGSIDLTKRPFPTPPVPYNFPEVPGLALRLATLDDIPGIAKIMTEKRNYPEDAAPKIVENTITGPFSWAFILEYNGKPLQYEAYYFGVPGATSYDCYLAYRVHFDRSRAHWFWKEAERPVWEWLRAAGCTTMGDMHRVNRKHWLRVTQELYGSEVVKQDEGYFHLRTNLDLNIFKGRPKRRTAGADWKFEYGNVTFREMRAAELLDVQQALRKEFRLLKGAARTAKLLETCYLLDNASVMLGYVDGNLKFVRTARERSKPTEANVATLNPVWVSPESDLAVYVTGVWLETQGYTSASTFVLDEQYTNSAVVEYLAKQAKHLKMKQSFDAYDGKMYELHTDVSAITKYSADEWMVLGEQR